MLRKDQKTAVIEANRTHETDTGSPEVQVDILVHDVGERIFCIVLFVHFHNLFQFYLGLYYDSGKNTTGKVTSVRNEIDF